MGKVIKWTDEQKEFVIKNANKYYDYQLAELFNERFGTHHPTNTICSFRQRLGVKKEKYVFDGRVNKSTKLFYSTPEQVKWMRDNVHKFKTINEITKEFNNTFNLDLPEYTVKYTYIKLGLKLNSGKHYYTKEENNWIKENFKFFKNEELSKLFEEKFGKKLSARQLKDKKGNMRLSYLKANNIKSHNELPIGAITKVTDKVVIKWKNEGKPNDWKPVGRYFYEKYYGSVPKGYCVYHLDGNQMNYSKENLILISKQEGGQIFRMCQNEHCNFFGQGKVTEAIVEVVRTENLIKEINENE